jgi:uncharacterized protein
LLAAHADLNVKSAEGRTALMMAAYFGHAKVVKALLDGGAKTEEKDNHGYTAADYAGSGKHNDIVELLNQAKSKPQS